MPLHILKKHFVLCAQCCCCWFDIESCGFIFIDFEIEIVMHVSHCFIGLFYDFMLFKHALLLCFFGKTIQNAHAYSELKWNRDKNKSNDSKNDCITQWYFNAISIVWFCFRYMFFMLFYCYDRVLLWCNCSLLVIQTVCFDLIFWWRTKKKITSIESEMRWKVLAPKSMSASLLRENDREGKKAK